jgi:hypothetical protein
MFSCVFAESIPERRHSCSGGLSSDDLASGVLGGGRRYQRHPDERDEGVG